MERLNYLIFTYIIRLKGPMCNSFKRLTKKKLLTGEEEESTIMDDSHGDSGHNGQNGQYEQNGQNGQIGHNGQIGQNGHAANVQMGATKFTIATQTSANPNSDN